MLKIGPGPFVGSPNANLSAYADDTALFVSKIEQIDISRSELKTYEIYSGSKINTSKSELFLMGRLEREPNCDRI
jgi:hypothetical protein